LYLNEDGYDEDVVPGTPWRVWGNKNDLFRSETHKININYCRRGEDLHDSRSTSSPFSIPFQVICDGDESAKLQNAWNSTIKYVNGKSPKTGTISNLGFPHTYEANNEIFTYSLVNEDGGLIRLSFDDWSLSPRSRIQV